MGDIREVINKLEEPDRSILKILIEFHEDMKSLEKDNCSGGKQATYLVMAVNDIKGIINKQKKIDYSLTTISKSVSMDIASKLKKYAKKYNVEYLEEVNLGFGLTYITVRGKNDDLKELDLKSKQI